MLQIDSALRGTDKNSTAIKAIDVWLLKQAAPKNFDGENSENELVSQQNSFQSVCSALEEMSIQNPHKLSTFRFYSLIKHFKNKPKPQQNENDN